MQQNNSRYYLNDFQAQPYPISDKVLPQMAETLGQLMKRRMIELQIGSNSELARLMGMSDAYIGDLINDTGKTKDGVYRPRPKTVKKLANALKVTELEILAAATNAPNAGTNLKKPQTPMEFFALLEEVGIDINLDGGVKSLEGLTGDDLQELLDSVAANASAKARRKLKELQAGM
jgi:transcriptional regulator with XRE-family HTH domain